MIDEVTMPVDDGLAAGRAALRAGDAVGARRVFEAALAQSPSAAATEGLARAAYLELDFGAAMELWEQAYSDYRADGDRLGAVRTARTLAPMHGMIVGDFAVMRGWLARAASLLDGDPDSVEHGWVALNTGMFEGDRERKDTCFRDALSAGRRFGDTDLEFVALAYLGASLVHADRVEEGMLLLDEALAAVAGRDVDDFEVLEEIFCQLFSACEHAHDVTRADQWMRIGDAIAARRRLPAVSAFCRTHYGGVMTAAGRWPEADAALTEAVRLWGLGRRSQLRVGALVRLADLRIRQGRIAEAAGLLDGIDVEADLGAARPLAAIHLARGDAALAQDVLERALQRLDPVSTSAVPLLALLVDVDLALADVGGAEAAAEQLDRCARRGTSPYLVAAAALARGQVCLARGAGDPQACLREALAGFKQAETPLELARSRLELASALLIERPEVALAEARAALAAFETLQAARHVDAATAVLRSLGVRTAPTRPGGDLLTRREAEVLALVGEGLSNPEIGDRLYISRKTVEHHVGNILSKLGLRNRAEAAAHAARAKPAGK